MVWSLFPWYLTSEPAPRCRWPRSGPRVDAAALGAARGARGAPGGTRGSTGARPRSVLRGRDSSSCVLESTAVTTVFWDKRLLSGSARPAPYQPKFRFSPSTDPILFASAIPSCCSTHIRAVHAKSGTKQLFKDLSLFRAFNVYFSCAQWRFQLK